MAQLRAKSEFSVLKLPPIKLSVGSHPTSGFRLTFSYLVLKCNKQALIRLAGGGAQPNISQKIIRELEIPLPPLEVQKEIVAEIEGYQKVINGARGVLDNYRPHIPDSSRLAGHRAERNLFLQEWPELRQNLFRVIP